jgi:hypothetical protein
MTPTATAGKRRVRNRLSAPVLQRAIRADKWIGRVRRAVLKQIKAQVREAADRMELIDPAEPVTEELIDGWTKELKDAYRPLAYNMIFEGRNLADEEFGSAKSVRGKGVQIAQIGGVAEGSVDDWEEFLQTHDFTGVEDRITEISERASRTTAGEIQRIFDKASVTRAAVGTTAKDIAALMRRRGIDNAGWRSVMWARTESIWSYNEGAHLRYIEEGVAVEEWVTAPDDALCDFCEAMDGKQVRVQDAFMEQGTMTVSNEAGDTKDLPISFDVGHPPLHPNCRCAVVAVF